MVVTAGLVIIVAIILGIFTAAQTYSNDKNVLADQNNRNTSVAHVLAIHPVMCWLVITGG
jgi:hypothetical protein